MNTRKIVEMFNKDCDNASVSMTVAQVFNEKEGCYDDVVFPLCSYMNKSGSWKYGDKEYLFTYFNPNNPDITVYDGAYVDTTTGELLAEVPVKSKRKTTYVTPFRDFSCDEDLQEWALTNGYKQTMTLHSDTSLWEDLIDTTPLLLAMRKVKYVNVGFYTREELCSFFGCDDKSLTRKLKQYAKVRAFKYETKGLFHKGQVRLVFHPVLCFRGSQQLQQVMQRSWLKADFRVSDSLVPNKEFFEMVAKIPQEEVDASLAKADIDAAMAIFEAHMQEDEVLGQEGKAINKCVAKYFGEGDSAKTRLLHCSDVDFKLYMRKALTIDDVMKV